MARASTHGITSVSAATSMLTNSHDFELQSSLPNCVHCAESFRKQCEIVLRPFMLKTISVLAATSLTIGHDIIVSVMINTAKPS